MDERGMKKLIEVDKMKNCLFIRHHLLRCEEYLFIYYAPPLVTGDVHAAISQIKPLGNLNYS